MTIDAAIEEYEKRAPPVDTGLVRKWFTEGWECAEKNDVPRFVKGAAIAAQMAKRMDTAEGGVAFLAGFDAYLRLYVYATAKSGS